MFGTWGAALTSREAAFLIPGERWVDSEWVTKLIPTDRGRPSSTEKEKGPQTALRNQSAPSARQRRERLPAASAVPRQRCGRVASKKVAELA
jgi:hypothetical protein